MAGGVREKNPEKLAASCENFMKGTKRLYDGERIKSCKGDMWFFELYHHLQDCADALRCEEQCTLAEHCVTDLRKVLRDIRGDHK